jgi:membrane protein YqaA with SNARE-associated domain
MGRKGRNIFNSFNIYARYYKSAGFYSFMFGNFLKILGFISLVVIMVLVINKFFINISDIPEWIIETYPNHVVFIFFIITESVLGMIPPDFFILWVSDLPNSYLMVSFLGFLSYIGGLNAYGLGLLIRQIPRVKVRMERFYANHITKIKKWGGVFILVAALFPLPYATICSVAGLMKYPFIRLVYFGIARIARFILYALLIYSFL